MIEAVRGALEPDPAKRYRDCDALLEAWTAAELTENRRVSTRTDTWDRAILHAAQSVEPMASTSTVDDELSSSTFDPFDEGPDPASSPAPAPAARPVRDPTPMAPPRRGTPQPAQRMMQPPPPRPTPQPPSTAPLYAAIGVLGLLLVAVTGLLVVIVGLALSGTL